MEQSRILIAAPKSGSGKTLVTIGLLRAFQKRGIRVSSFKCGPDYIDPLFHRAVLGVPSGNLDPFFSDETQLRQILAREAAGSSLAVLEGVMGYYDGLGAVSTEASTYDAARITDTPVLLVVDARGAALSNLALVCGFLKFVPSSGIRGILLNRCTKNTYLLLKEKAEAQFSVPVLGYLPKLPQEQIPSRHLGLFLPHEIGDLQEKADHLAKVMEETVELDQILKLAEEAGPLPDPEPFPKRKDAEPVRIALAEDEAFCFYYRENLELLESLGAELVPFSPLHDVAVPEHCSGLILGGGYPELHAQQLSENTPMLESIRRAASQNLPIVAECGGFLYLHESLEDEKGRKWPMAGILPAQGERSDSLTHFGYVTLTARKDTFLLKKGETIRGHEFHYWKSTNPGDAFLEEKPTGSRHWNGVLAERGLFAGFPHLYLPSAPQAAQRFLERSRHFQEKL